MEEQIQSIEDLKAAIAALEAENSQLRADKESLTLSISNEESLRKSYQDDSKRYYEWYSNKCKELDDRKKVLDAVVTILSIIK